MFDRVTPEMRIYKEEIFGPVCRWSAHDYEEALRLPTETVRQRASRSSPATATPPATSAPASRSAWSASTSDPGPIAYHTFGGWKRSGSRPHQHGPDSIRSTPRPRR
ncbi:aldehyde dehydrogenase family protein [Rhodococcus hoagii]|nr:aldehyde dehydrogenase family protein [Prescottella equi]